MDEYRAANTAFYSNRPLVAVFIGGTAGIGEQAVRALVSQYANDPGPLRIYIVGRNNDAASKIITDCKQTHPRAHFEFLQATDLTSIKDTTAVCETLLRNEQTKYSTSSPRIDLLVMTQGALSFRGREENAEGLDRQISLLYYSRIRCIQTLMPLLSASASPHVISVFGGGMEGKLLQDDLSCRDPKTFSVAQVRSHVAYMTTMAFERLARESESVSLVHVFPGLVVTPAFDDNDHPLWMKVAWAILGPVARRTIAVPLDESGRRIISLGTQRFAARRDARDGNGGGAVVGTDGQTGSGAYAVGQDCKPVRSKVDYEKLKKERFEDKVWSHTKQVFSDIEKNGRFDG